MIHLLYRQFMVAASPLIYLYLLQRQRRGKEDRERFHERLGRAKLPRPDGPLIWLHAASVGEAQSVLTLIARLRAERPHVRLLVTTGTVTSARLLRDRLPPGAFHQYVPVDRPLWVARFLEHWRPDLALWVESELWPNMIAETHHRRIPMVLLNGRMSAKSFAGWQRAPSLVRPLLAGFSLCFAQSSVEAARFARLGARRVQTPGNLKYAADPLPTPAEELAALRNAIGARPVWLAASTHSGEEEIIAAAHRILARARPNLLTIIAPRHAARGAALARELAMDGIVIARRAADQTITPQTSVYLADTMGELGLFYRLAPIVFVGGSLVAHGGQNVLEPARQDCAIVHGPHMWNFQEIVSEMYRVEATREVADAESLAREVNALLADPAARASRAAAARGVADAHRGVLDRVLSDLAPLLDALDAPSGRHARA
jgi:3-deoxy-D-manno-octulosonic-acid transferase